MDNGRAVRLARRLDGAVHFHHDAAEARVEPPWLEELMLEPTPTWGDLVRPPCALARAAG